MKNISRAEDPEKTFRLPGLIGWYLAVNAVSDACLVVDGSNCVMPKIDFIAGSHDLRSTLLSAEGRHRVVCTMTNPLPQDQNPERKLSALLSGAAGGGFGVLLLTGLPFLKMAGMDYEGLAAGLDCGVPAAGAQPGACPDWLDGYEQALDALVRALPAGAVRKRKNSAAVVGYLADRGERDHSANLSELRSLLGMCGLERVCFFPSGGDFSELRAALEAEVVVSLPYGRKAAARLAARTGAALVETGLPMGLAGTGRWLARVSAAAGRGSALPRAALLARRAAAEETAPLLEALAHRNLVFAGDPFLFAAFAAFAGELRMRVSAAFLDSFARPLGEAARTRTFLFSPDAEEVRRALSALPLYSRPDLAVGNSFSATEGYFRGLPFLEFGFPSYAHHCLSDEPFFGFSGARCLAGRVFNALRSGPEPAAPASDGPLRAAAAPGTDPRRSGFR